MKNVIVFLVLVLSLFCAPYTTSSENKESDWFPFVLAEKLDPASLVNIGKLVLDAPAGKHGFVTARDGHFYFEDGTRARFWGTNLCFDACFPSKEQAEMMAERIAFFAFNAVRFHSMDSHFEPRGIFKDVCPTYQDPQLKNTGILSEKQLDRLDYLIYQLKKRGIYVDMNLLVSRRFTEADGIIDADKFRTAAKPISMFNQKLIELQKKYAKDLLTHYNPYTKLRYRDDPAIALIEITNENSIIQYWKMDKLNNQLPYSSREPIPEFYMIELDIMWNNWLKRKHGTVENMKKAWKLRESTVRSPQLTDFQIGKKKWIIEQHNGAKGSRGINGENIILNIENVTDTSWHLQYRTTGVKLLRGKNYLLKFTASADRRLRIFAFSQQAYSPWNNLGLTKELNITSKSETYQIPFKASDDCSNAKVGFIIGEVQGKILLKDIELKEIDPLPFIAEERNLSEFKFHRPLYSLLMFYTEKMIDDIKEFYVGLGRNYFKNMADFLRRECKVKVPITGMGGYWHSEDVEAQEPCDFIDTHAYWDHPRFPNKRWDRNDFRIHNKSMLLDENLGIIADIIRRTPSPRSKPYTITEWNHCYPNQYAYETPILIASEAAKNSWDALFQFDFKAFLLDSPKIDSIDNYFEIMANPQQLILLSLSSLVFYNSNNLKTTVSDGVLTVDAGIVKGTVGFIKDKTIIFGSITLTTNQDGAVFLYSSDHKPLEESKKLMLVIISEVKNKNSGWNSGGKFQWGNVPTIAGTISVDITIKTASYLKVYELNNSGVRDKEINTNYTDNKISFSTKEATTLWFEIIAE